MSKWKASNWNNISSEAIKQYWQRSVFLLFLKVAFCEMEARFSQKKKIIKRSSPSQKFVMEHDENKINEFN